MKKRPYTDSRYQSDDRKINIMHIDDHYYAMRSITACFAISYICPDCHATSTTATSHKCKYACSFCESTPQCESVQVDDLITCPDCNRDFLGDLCFVKHILPKGTGKLSVCDARKKCPICQVVHRSIDEHYCGIFFCKICEDYQPYTHQCHMPTYQTKRKDDKNILTVYYDFETQQDTPLGGTEPNEPKKFRHVPNLCVLQTSCFTCSANPNIHENCPDCRIREHIYDSKDCVIDLVEYLVKKSNEKVTKIINRKQRKIYKFDRIVAIAHNMSGFDGAVHSPICV